MFSVLTHIVRISAILTFWQVADFLVADTYLDVALESTRDLLLQMQVGERGLGVDNECSEP